MAHRTGTFSTFTAAVSLSAFATLTAGAGSENPGGDQATISAASKASSFIPLFGMDVATSLDSVAESLGATPMQVALAWLVQRSPNILLIPGTSSVRHLHENLEAATLALPSDAVAKLNAIAAESEQTTKSKENV